jgi:hypothetical protein
MTNKGHEEITMALKKLSIIVQTITEEACCYISLNEKFSILFRIANSKMDEHTMHECNHTKASYLSNIELLTTCFVWTTPKSM